MLASVSSYSGNHLQPLSLSLTVKREKKHRRGPCNLLVEAAKTDVVTEGSSDEPPTKQPRTEPENNDLFDSLAPVSQSSSDSLVLEKMTMHKHNIYEHDICKHNICKHNKHLTVTATENELLRILGC